jgi:ferredoxin-nitrite reductase
MSGQDFSDEQKRYLEGFVSGVQASRAAAGLKPLSGVPGSAGQPAGPDAEHLKAMVRFEAQGKKLSPEEKAKRDEHPFDAYARLKAESDQGQYPKALDNFRWRFHGLFHVAPAQNSYMCRLRVPNGILTQWQLAGVGRIAELYCNGYAHVTTRANLQVREIEAGNAIAVLEALAELGLATKGSGADNIRNVTGSPTAGIDKQELLDTRPFARAWHHHILNDRSLYGLPRKFNVGFDGGGVIPVLEDTNDIAFTAVEVHDGDSASPGVCFKLGLGGITGHKDFARSTGVLVKPEDAVAVADAIVRVFIDHGDRTDRKKARLKYVLDAWGFDKYLGAVEEKLGRSLARVPREVVAAPNRQHRQAHIGVHAQKQPGLVWVGVSLPVGRMTSAQMHGLAAISHELGDGDIRLTVWQNLLISGVAETNAAEVERRLQALGLTCQASSVRAGLVACTGNTGCKFALSNTKDTAMAIAAHVEANVSLDTPINLHLTGCPNSCAQHYIGDIGMIACRIPAAPDSDDIVEGFHLLVGGGFGVDAAIGRELYSDVKVEDCPALVTRMLKAYLSNRLGAETFMEFSRRHEASALRALVNDVAEEAAA